MANSSIKLQCPKLTYLIMEDTFGKFYKISFSLESSSCLWLNADKIESLWDDQSFSQINRSKGSEYRRLEFMQKLRDKIIKLQIEVKFILIELTFIYIQI